MRESQRDRVKRRRRRRRRARGIEVEGGESETRDRVNGKSGKSFLITKLFLTRNLFCQSAYASRSF